MQYKNIFRFLSYFTFNLHKFVNLLLNPLSSIYIKNFNSNIKLNSFIKP